MKSVIQSNRHALSYMFTTKAYFRFTMLKDTSAVDRAA